MELIEILGFAATVIILISFLLKGEMKIRIVNSFGAALFAVYGIIIGAWSVWVLNIALMIVHAIYLLKAPKKRRPMPEQKAVDFSGKEEV